MVVEIKVYNTLTHKKELFKPIDPTCIKVYVCGPTVYQAIHLGNIRSLVVFDMWIRLLKLLYPKVIYVRNITDVDDKIIKQAKALGISPYKLVKDAIAQFHIDAATLNLLPPDIEPCVTQEMSWIIYCIQQIIAKGYGYVVDGHVLFDVTKFPQYGQFAHQDLAQVQSSMRVDSTGIHKKTPWDFVLWKPKVDDEISWSSPWSQGRPGWHIECSAMAYHYLGEQFDIHGGGMDLVFPHHQNEIAQSWALTGKIPANYWLHNGFLLLDDQKMSKSLGNIINLEQFLATDTNYNCNLLRLTMLMTHYHQPLLFSANKLKEAQNILHNWTKSIEKVDNSDVSKVKLPVMFIDALADDLNVPQAISIMHQTCDPLILKRMGLFLGIFSHKDLFQTESLTFSAEETMLIEQRNQARKSKDFHTADIIRNKLISCGIEVRDRDSDHTDYFKKSC